jgi:hypothetical protein
MTKRPEVVVVAVLAISLSGCLDVTASPKQSDIAQGDVASIAFRARDDTSQGIRVVPNAPATIKLLSGANCGTLRYQPPAPGAAFATVSGATQTTTTDSFGRVRVQFTGGPVLQDCTAKIETKVRDESDTATVIVHAPVGIGSGTSYQPNNGLSVTPGPPPTDTATKFIIYQVVRSRGDAALRPGTTVCVACPTRNDPNFKWGVIWGRRLTISPTPGVEYDLSRQSTSSVCTTCGSANRYKIPGSITR